MLAWAFEAASCPIRPNEVKKTKLQNNTSPQACISTMLCARWACRPFYISPALSPRKELFKVRVAVEMSVDLIRPVRVNKSCLVASKFSATLFSNSQKMDLIHSQSKCRRTNASLRKLNSQLPPNSQRWSFNLSTETSQSQPTQIFRKKTFDGQKVVKLSAKPALVFPHLAHNGHGLMQAWAFEATSCPTRPNEVKKTKRQNNTSPQACISIVLCAGWACRPFYISPALSSHQDLFQVRVAVKMSFDLLRPVRVDKRCLVALKFSA